MGDGDYDMGGGIDMGGVDDMGGVEDGLAAGAVGADGLLLPGSGGDRGFERLGSVAAVSTGMAGDVDGSAGGRSTPRDVAAAAAAAAALSRSRLEFNDGDVEDGVASTPRRDVNPDAPLDASDPSKWHAATKQMLLVLAGEMDAPPVSPEAVTGAKKRKSRGRTSAAAEAALPLANVSEGRGSTSDPLSFRSLADGSLRRTAALSFYQLLQLKTLDVIDLEQSEAFGDVLISRTVRTGGGGGGRSVRLVRLLARLHTHNTHVRQRTRFVLRHSANTPCRRRSPSSSRRSR